MHTIFTTRALVWISPLVLSAGLLTAAHAQDIQIRQQSLSDLYQKAQASDGLWRGVTQRYQQAMDAVTAGDLDLFNTLYDRLYFDLSTGLQQAKEQQGGELVPSYLSQ